MTHHHLRFKSSDGFESNADDDQYRSTAHRNVHSGDRHMEQNGEYSDYTETNSADESDL